MSPGKALPISIGIGFMVGLLGLVFIYGFKVIKKNIKSPFFRACLYLLWFFIGTFTLGSYQNHARQARNDSRQNALLPPTAHSASKPASQPKAAVAMPSEKQTPVPSPPSTVKISPSTLPTTAAKTSSIAQKNILKVNNKKNGNASLPDKESGFTHGQDLTDLEQIQLENTKVHIDELGKAFGFIEGQRLRLQQIAKQYPSLALHVHRVEAGFKSAFGKAEQNITKILKVFFADKYQEFYDDLLANFTSFISSQSLTYDAAIEFIGEVDLRIEGIIPSPIFETLLNYQFEENPVEEMIRGFKGVYSTKGHRKSEGLNVEFEYPLSWQAKEGKRPHIIQLFNSNNGRGRASAIIMARDFLKEAREQGIPITPEDIAEINTPEGAAAFIDEFSSDSRIKFMIADMSLKNIRDIRKQAVVIDKWPGIMLEFSGDGERLDLKMAIYNRYYIIMYKHYMVSFMFAIYKFPNESDEVMNNAIKDFSPLFRLMVNSIVIQNQYY